MNLNLTYCKVTFSLQQTMVTKWSRNHQPHGYIKGIEKAIKNTDLVCLPESEL
jgi:hypothetical protein